MMALCESSEVPRVGDSIRIQSIEVKFYEQEVIGGSEYYYAPNLCAQSKVKES